MAMIAHMAIVQQAGGEAELPFFRPLLTALVVFLLPTAVSCAAIIFVRIHYLAGAPLETRDEWNCAIMKVDLALSFALAALTYRTVQRRLGRRQRGLCQKCGYDLRASRESCPECGTIAIATVERLCSMTCAERGGLRVLRNCGKPGGACCALPEEILRKSPQILMDKRFIIYQNLVQQQKV